MKVLIASAGGGHFSPAVSVIKELNDATIVVVGRKYALEGGKTIALEYAQCQSLGIRFIPIITGRLQRTFTKHTIPSLLKVPFGLVQATAILLKEKPDVVVSFGGYVAVPVVIAAKLLRIPVVIHEQTLGVGLANKIAAKFADKICVSWESSLVHFPKAKTVVTGNPLKPELLAMSRSAKRKATPMIYVTGGSVGSHAVNVLVEEALPQLTYSFTLLHQTGDAAQYNDYARLEAAKQELSEKQQKAYTLKKFLTTEEVVAAFAAADLIVSRAGIGTVTELLFVGKPCILIPLPFGQTNEQMKNAQFLKEQGLAEILDQRTASGDQLVALCKKIIEQSDRYDAAGKKARQLVNKDAAKRIAAIIKGCAT